ncbi:hypothetical protein BJ138DRAFT_1109792 [Hygrophoropsis aurantiaca]|uniref:Uncharacterized protein n=1 Tax=Hygrophoropsis aurantiaca TaxID=72124 RepID=A0ACB8AQF2_9AGAM|nr:hypothetical protein BJ138DRAFT_1109792 [Hygrophoropsis aurantiaca]
MALSPATLAPPEMSQFIDSTQPTSENATLRSPFDDSDADLIFQTSDGVKFGVHKLILGIASPLLKRLFSSSSTSPLPNEVVVIKKDEGQDVIPVEEDSQTTEAVLRFCYPFANPVVDNLDKVVSILEMMKRLGMKGITDRVKASLVQPAFLDEEPLRVFSIAYRHGLEHETRLAAKHTLRQPIFGPYVKELDHIPASVYHRLLQYHRKCSVATCALTADFSWFPGFASRWVWFQCDDCEHHPLSWPLSDGKIYEVNSWFIEFMERARSVLRERPCAKVVHDPLLITESLDIAAGCLTCRSSAFMDLNTFIDEHFDPEVEKTVDAVDLEITF